MEGASQAAAEHWASDSRLLLYIISPPKRRFPIFSSHYIQEGKPCPSVASKGCSLLCNKFFRPFYIFVHTLEMRRKESAVDSLVPNASPFPFLNKAFLRASFLRHPFS